MFRTLIANVLSLILALTFISFGVIKLVPTVYPDVHRKVSEEFVKYAKLHPATYFGHTIDSGKLLTQVGLIEVVCGTLLLVGPRLIKLFCNLVLTSIVISGVYFMYALNESVVNITGCLVLLFGLFLRLNFEVSHMMSQCRIKEAENEEISSKKNK